MLKITSPSRTIACDVLSAAERIELDDKAWLSALMLAIERSIGCGDQSTGTLIGWTPEMTLHLASSTEGGMPVGAIIDASSRLGSEHEKRGWIVVDGIASLGETIGSNTSLREAVTDLGVGEPVALLARAGLDETVILAAHHARAIEVVASSRIVWQRLARHIGRCQRLRRALGALPVPDAVFAPDGTCVDAGPTLETDALAREQLRRHVLLRERARLREVDPGEFVDAWTEIVERRWTVVDQFDGDGRRWLVVWDNPMGDHDPRALTANENAAVRRMLAGWSNQDAAVELGVSASTASRILASALHKLGGIDRGTLASLSGPASIGRVLSLPIGIEELRAIGLPLTRAEDLSILTPAEREIVPLLLEGYTNRQIALARGSSERTVANQVRAIFDKLGVGSRRELLRYIGSALGRG
jgi:DNA-binding NarL/FixJ family response regulator